MEETQCNAEFESKCKVTEDEWKEIVQRKPAQSSFLFEVSYEFGFIVQQNRTIVTLHKKEILFIIKSTM